MGKMPIRSVYGKTYCHESEDPAKVQQAFELFFSKKDINIQSQKGAFGTSITILSAEIEHKKAKELAKKVLNSISASDRKQLIDQLRLRTDEKGKFYLRFDKQIAFEKEKMSLTSEEDTIQIVFSLEAYPAKYENYLDVAKELISENR